MCDVIFVAEEKLERMLSEWKRDLCLGLSRAKMQVIEIIWNGSIQRREWDVHHQVRVLRATLGKSSDAASPNAFVLPGR